MHHKPLVRPVFLVCSERSGSNLIARIFGSHSEYYAPSPAHLFRIFSTFDDELDIDFDLLRLFRVKLGVWKIDRRSDEELMAVLAKENTIARKVAALLSAEGMLHQKPRLFLKENSAHAFLPMMEAVAEDPGYVHMIRDPRDMAVSWVSAPTLRGGVVRAARRWLSDAQGAMNAEQGGRSIARLTYEALVQAPEETLRRVCDTLDVSFDVSMLAHVGHSDGVAQDASRTALWKNLSRGIMHDNFNKFQGRLDDDEIAYIEALCGPLMSAFGYEKSRAPDAPEFGSHGSFAALETALVAREPWSKPAYQDLPQEERARLEAWSALRDELVAKHGSHSTTPRGV